MQCVNEQERTICYRKKNDLSFSWIYPVIENEFCHIIDKGVCGSTQLLPCGSTATLTVYDKICDQ